MNNTPTTKTPYSLVIITLNAANQIEACISSAPSANEVIVVDSGSSDNTQAIALAMGATVIEQPWLGFGPQKQFAVNAAKNEWVLCLDADEALSTELHTHLQTLLSNEPPFKAYRIARRNHFMGRALRFGEGYPDWNLRLFHKKYAQWSNDSVHERVVSSESIGTIPGDLIHKSALQIGQYVNKQNSYTTIQAGTLYKQGKKATALKLILSPFVRFIRYYFFRLGFRDGIPGLVHTSIGSFNSFLKYAKLIELQKSDSQSSQDK